MQSAHALHQMNPTHNSQLVNLSLVFYFFNNRFHAELFLICFSSKREVGGSDNLHLFCVITKRSVLIFSASFILAVDLFLSVGKNVLLLLFVCF